MNLNVRKVMLIPQQIPSKQALNTTWKAFYKSLMPLIMFLFFFYYHKFSHQRTSTTHHGVPAEG